MDGVFGASGRKRLPLINITPLVDVMLLLVIFFAVTSTFEKSSGLPVLLPKSSEGTAQDAGQSDRTIHVLGKDHFSFGGKTGLTVQELENVLRANLAADPNATVVLRAEASATYQEYIDALGAVKRSGVRKLVLETQPTS